MLGYLWEDLLDNIDKFKLFSNKLGVSPFCLKLVLRCILLFALLETTKVSRVLWGASLSFFLVSFLAFLIFVFNLSIRFGWEGLNEYCYMKYLRRSIYLMDLILRLSLLFYIINSLKHTEFWSRRFIILIFSHFNNRIHSIDLVYLRSFCKHRFKHILSWKE